MKKHLPRAGKYPNSQTTATQSSKSSYLWVYPALSGTHWHLFFLSLLLICQFCRVLILLAMFTSVLLALVKAPFPASLPFSLPCCEARSSQECPNTSWINVQTIFAPTVNNGDESLSTWSVWSLSGRIQLEKAVSCFKNSSQYLGK